MRIFDLNWPTPLDRLMWMLLGGAVALLAAPVTKMLLRLMRKLWNRFDRVQREALRSQYERGFQQGYEKAVRDKAETGPLARHGEQKPWGHF